MKEAEAETETQQAPTPPSETPKGGSGCLGSLIGVLFVVVCIVVWIKWCGSSGSTKATSPTTAGSASAAPVVSSSASSPPPSASVIRSPSDAAVSAFDALWNTAEDPDPHQNYDAMFATVMAKADYCERYRCGDEFKRDEVWNEARDRAAALQKRPWRTVLPLDGLRLLTSGDGFEVGECNVAKRECPITLQWPRYLGGSDPNDTMSGGRTSASPTRTPVKRMLPFAGGDPVTLWEKIKTPALTVKFPDVDAAQAWKTQRSKTSVLRLVYRVTSAAVDTHKETHDGVTVDSGAGGLVLIKVLGTQLVDGDAVLAEKL